MIYFVLLIAFTLRIFPRLILPNAISDDGYSHYEDVNLLKKSGYVPPPFYTKSVLKQIFGYPYGLMYLFVFVPKKFHRFLELGISPLSDTVMIYLAYRFFKDLTEINNLVIDEEWFCLFGGVLATYSAYLRNDSGPRAYHGSSRVISQLFFVALNYCYFLYTYSGNTGMLFLSLVLGFLLILFSIFGTQVFVLTGIVVIVSGYYTYSVTLLGSFLLFYLLLGRKGRQMLLARIWHYEWYSNFFQHVHLAKRSFLSQPLKDYATNLYSWVRLLVKGNLKSLLIYINIYNNPIHLLVTSYFPFFFIFATGLMGNDATEFAVFLALGCVFSFVFTLFRRFLFLGESYRYLEFGICFAMALFFIFLYRYREISVWIVYCWIIAGLVRYIFYQLEFFRQYRSEDRNYANYKKTFAEISTLIDGNTYGSSFFRTRAAYFGDFNYIALRGMQNVRIESLKSHQLAFGNYPFPDFDFRKVVTHFDLKYWLTNRREFEVYLEGARNFGAIEGLVEKVFEDKDLDIVLFKINREKF